MNNTSPISSNIVSRITDLVVLAVSFLLFSLVIGSSVSQHSLLDMVFYVAVLFVSIRLAKRLCFSVLEHDRRCLYTIFGNIIGIIVGVALVLVLDSFLPVLHEDMLVVIFSSLMAFFVLGTLAPVIKSSRKDIVHH